MQVAAISRPQTSLHVPLQFPASLSEQGCAVSACAAPWNNWGASTFAASLTAWSHSRKAGLCLTYSVELLVLEK